MEGCCQADQKQFCIIGSMRESISFLLSSVMGKLWTPDKEMVLNFYICKVEMAQLTSYKFSSFLIILYNTLKMSKTKQRWENGCGHSLSQRGSVKIGSRWVSFIWEVESPVIRADAFFFTGSFQTDEEWHSGLSDSDSDEPEVNHATGLG